MSEPITFDANIKKTSAKTLVSGDMEYETVLRSEDDNLYKLGEIDGTLRVTVTVEVNE